MSQFECAAITLNEFKYFYAQAGFITISGAMKTATFEDTRLVLFRFPRRTGAIRVGGRRVWLLFFRWPTEADALVVRVEVVCVA